MVAKIDEYLVFSRDLDEDSKEADDEHDGIKSKADEDDRDQGSLEFTEMVDLILSKTADELEFGLELRLGWTKVSDQLIDQGAFGGGRMTDRS